MTDLRQLTIETYNNSAKELAEYFSGIGARTEDIKRAFELNDNHKYARVLEIGCGDGRDAVEIVKMAAWYEGFDISKELIRIAKSRLPDAKFTVADAADFPYPPNLDIIFAFASLLHLDSEEVSAVLQKAHDSLNPGGIFYISLKYRAKYTSEVKKDHFGERLFYFYSPEIIKALAGNNYVTAFNDRKTIGHTDWFEIALRKI